MGNFEVTVVIKGGDTLRRALNPAQLAGGAARRFLDRWGIATASRARERAPVDRGRLRNSLTNETDPGPDPLSARVGTNLSPEAEAMEFGTGLLSDGPNRSGVRHVPPPAALDGWARRHGIAGGGFVVARAIARRGGLKPRRYLRGAVKDTEPRINDWLDLMAREIEADAARGLP